VTACGRELPLSSAKASIKNIPFPMPRRPGKETIYFVQNDDEFFKKHEKNVGFPIFRTFKHEKTAIMGNPM
jgi:hypothetical protein